MKHIFSNQSEFRVHLEEQIARIRKRVVRDAENDAAQGRPTIEESNGGYFYEHHLSVQGLLDSNASHYGTDSIKHSGAHQMAQAKERIGKLENELYKTGDLRMDAESEMQQKRPPYNIWRVRLATAGMVLTSGFEGAWSIPIWESVIGLGYYESLATGGLFAVVIGVLCHLVAELLKRIRNRFKRRATALVVMTVCFLLFWQLGQLRAEYLTQESVSQYGIASNISALPFGIMSTLLVFVGIGLSYFFLPTKAQRAEMDEYRRLEKEVTDLKQRREELNQQIEAEKQQISDELLQKLERYEQGTMTEQWLINQAHLLHATYCKSNIAFRKSLDGVIPSCFSTGYPFDFKTYYNRKNENN